LSVPVLKILEIPLNEETLVARVELTPLPFGGFASTESASLGACCWFLPATYRPNRNETFLKAPSREQEKLLRIAVLRGSRTVVTAEDGVAVRAAQNYANANGSKS
jgi:hypothetical protein